MQVITEADHACILNVSGYPIFEFPEMAFLLVVVGFSLVVKTPKIRSIIYCPKIYSVNTFRVILRTDKLANQNKNITTLWCLCGGLEWSWLPEIYRGPVTHKIYVKGKLI